MRQPLLIPDAMICFSGKLDARKRACPVWEGGNGEGPQSTSSVPYFIREGAVGNVLVRVTRWPPTSLSPAERKRGSGKGKKMIEFISKPGEMEMEENQM